MEEIEEPGVDVGSFTPNSLLSYIEGSFCS